MPIIIETLRWHSYLVLTRSVARVDPRRVFLANDDDDRSLVFIGLQLTSSVGV